MVVEELVPVGSPVDRAVLVSLEQCGKGVHERVDEPVRNRVADGLAVELRVLLWSLAGPRILLIGLVNSINAAEFTAALVVEIG